MKVKISEVRPDKILIRSTNWIGDAIMNTPAVRTVRENFPDAEISILATPWVADVFAANPYIDKIIIYDKAGKHKGPRGRFLLVRELAQMKFDMAILLQKAFEAALLTSLSRIPVRAGYSTDFRRLLLTHPVRVRKAVKKIHQVYFYQEMLKNLGLTPGPDELFLQLPETAATRADEFLADLRQGNGNLPIMGLNPGAAYGPAKRWPAEKFSELAMLSVRDLQAKILVFGTKADTGTAAEIIENNPGHVIDLTGKTSLAEAMALIKRCNVFVTNDSGLMHVAAALKTPVVAVFGSTNPITTGPFSNNSIVIRKNISCSPCLKTHCRSDFRCMQEIGSNEVFEAVNTIFESIRL